MQVPPPVEPLADLEDIPKILGRAKTRFLVGSAEPLEVEKVRAALGDLDCLVTRRRMETLLQVVVTHFGDDSMLFNWQDQLDKYKLAMDIFLGACYIYIPGRIRFFLLKFIAECRLEIGYLQGNAIEEIDPEKMYAPRDLSVEELLKQLKALIDDPSAAQDVEERKQHIWEGRMARAES